MEVKCCGMDGDGKLVSRGRMGMDTVCAVTDGDLLARDSMLSALYAIANLSVCPSVCHTGGSVENG